MNKRTFVGIVIALALLSGMNWWKSTQSVRRVASGELLRVVVSLVNEVDASTAGFGTGATANNYSLVPSRYIEFVDRDTEIDYKTALAEANAKAVGLLARQSENAARLKAAFEKLGGEVNHV